MSEPVEYQEFARARAHQLFRIAYLMCGDWHEAQDLVQVCLAEVYVSWDRIQRHEAVDAYARKILLRTYLSDRRPEHDTGGGCGPDRHTTSHRLT